MPYKNEIEDHQFLSGCLDVGMRNCYISNRIK